MSAGRHAVREFVEGRREVRDGGNQLERWIRRAVAFCGDPLLEYDGHGFPANVPGGVGGCCIAAMLDSVATLSPTLTLSEQKYGPTVQLTVNFLRGTGRDQFLSIARTVTMTRTMAFVQAGPIGPKNDMLASETVIQRISTTGTR